METYLLMCKSFQIWILKMASWKALAKYNQDACKFKLGHPVNGFRTYSSL